MTTARQRLEQLESFNAESLEALLRPLAEELGLKTGQLFGALRTAVTGRTVDAPAVSDHGGAGQGALPEADWRRPGQTESIILVGQGKGGVESGGRVLIGTPRQFDIKLVEMNKKGEISTLKAWLIVLASLLDVDIKLAGNEQER